jgi:hypothetical protein
MQFNGEIVQPKMRFFYHLFQNVNLSGCTLASAHPEMAFFRNLCVNAPKAHKSAESLVRRTVCTSPRNSLISLILRKISHF